MQVVVGIIFLVILLALAANLAPWFLLAAFVGFFAWFLMRQKQHPKRNGIRNLSIGLLIYSLLGFGIHGAIGHSDTAKNPVLATSAPSNSAATKTQVAAGTEKTAPSGSNQTSSNSSAPSVTAVTSTSKSSLSAVATSNLISVVVSKDVDGDTIHVTMPDGKDETIRMLLIDTPETVDPKLPVEPFGPEASTFAKEELPVGKHIWIEEGAAGYTRDKYNRLLAYVYLTPTDMYNEDVVKRGLARVAYIYPPNTQHLSELEADQQYAKSHHLGIWSIPGYVTDSGYNVNVKKSTSSSSASSNKSNSSTASKSSSTKETGLTITYFTSDVSPGDYATISVKTSPGATGYIEVDYYSGPSHASGLGPQTADGSGTITWTWKVGTRTRSGDWPVTVTVGSKTIQATLHVH